MEITRCWTAARTDAALSAAHGSTLLASRTVTPKRLNDGMVSFIGAPAYVVDQEPHPPRGSTA